MAHPTGVQLSSKNNGKARLTRRSPPKEVRGVQRELANLFGSLRDLKKKAPAPAATGARAGNLRLGSARFTPLYVNPFSGAIEPTDVREAFDRELDRRLCNVARIARSAA